MATAQAAIFARDDNTCQCCGFVSQKYQQILQLDGNPNNMAPDNCLTTCVFCHQVFDLHHTAKLQSGMLIWLPEIGQAALHHLMRAIYVARVTPGSMADTAKKLYEQLMQRGTEAKHRLGTTDPASLAIVLREFLGGAQYAARKQRLEGIRLLPLDRRMVVEDNLEYNQFPQILAYWRSKNGPFSPLPAADWLKLAEQLAA
jgi:intracellular multiplication protein IcmJ